MSGRRYRDRTAAGNALVTALRRSDLGPNMAVLALPRGGVPVAARIAEALSAPLGVVVVRKIGAPGHRELAMGAVAMIGDALETFANTEVMRSLGVSEEVFDRVQAAEVEEARARLAAWGQVDTDVEGRNVILVDDGLATGSTMMAAVRAVRGQRPSRIVVAVPVAARPSLRLLGTVADDVVCPWTPSRFGAVGAFYDDFSQTSDAEVSELLQRHQ